MILRGILERSLGGFICLRGFAPLNELAQISKPEKSYQRELVEEHRKDIEDFLDSREYVYFPEITLSYSINAQLDNIKLSTSSDLLDLGSVKDKVVKANQFNKPYVSKSDQRDQDLIRIVTIEIDDDKGLGLLNRIDGNHRLSASENVAVVQADILTPFCLILLAGEEDTNARARAYFVKNVNQKEVLL
ncbi:hypothetical protein [Pseudoalteromonas fuliginea]|uniref:hypothetical protein n=1 Tax=Pseudoalteromonas fuliginea TaxID=1872678 RepID=UPI00317C4711